MAGTGSRPACQRCARVEDLQHQVAELQEVVRRLHNIRESEKELDSWFQAQSAMHSQTAKNSPTSTHRREGSQ